MRQQKGIQRRSGVAHDVAGGRVVWARRLENLGTMLRRTLLALLGLGACAAWSGPSVSSPSRLLLPQRRAVQPRCAGDASPMDALIAQLRESTPEKMPEVLAANMKSIDQRLFLRLAEMSDEEEDEFEKLRIRQLATTVTTTLEALLKDAETQLNADAQAVQGLLAAMASADGQFEVPVPEERITAVRADIRGQLATLDEGFVGTTKAYMQRASDDGLDGMVEVLRQLLQAYAAERLVALVGGRLDDSVRDAIVGILEVPRPLAPCL